MSAETRTALVRALQNTEGADPCDDCGCPGHLVARLARAHLASERSEAEAALERVLDLIEDQKRWFDGLPHDRGDRYWRGREDSYNEDLALIDAELTRLREGTG